MSQLKVVSDPAALSREAAKEFLRVGAESVRAHGRFMAALSGGSTPRATYERIAETWKEAPGGPLDWSRVHLFWGDERHVPPEDPQSNFHMANGALIEHVPIPAENVHPVPATIPDAQEAASRYEARIMETFHLGPDDVPRFDLILLGMGPDGHVASIFPGTKAVDEEKRLVMGNWVESHRTWRITVTFPVLNNAASVIVLVAGREKAEALRKALRGPHRPPLLPAERLNPVQGTLLWLADRDAAGAPDRIDPAPKPTPRLGEAKN